MIQPTVSASASLFFGAPIRYRLRTLIILLAVLPPLMAGAWITYVAWQAEVQRKASIPVEVQTAPTPMDDPFAEPSFKPMPPEPASREPMVIDLDAPASQRDRQAAFEAAKSFGSKQRPPARKNRP